MSKNYKNINAIIQVGSARATQHQKGIVNTLEKNFDIKTIHYLDEKIINHLLDSLMLEELGTMAGAANHFNDYSFLTAPAYKALEGFLFQIAKDLELPSAGSSRYAGSYYIDETKVDKQIDKLIKELESKTGSTTKLSKYEKKDIKDRIKEMQGFLQHYRHAPAHFFGEPIDTVEKARRNIMTIFGCIDNSAKILLKSKLIQIPAMNFQILEAVYGAPEGSIDVIAELNNFIKNNRFTIKASNDIAGDPAPGIVKKLRVKYIIDGEILEKECKEGEQIDLS